MILVLDNYDSFTYNLVHLLYALKAEVVVCRNDQLTVEQILNLGAAAILFSPGPGRPETAGIMPDLIRAACGSLPMLGICLGHQAIGQAFGAAVVPAQHIRHGKISRIDHNGQGLFAGLKNAFKAVRYHSLALQESSLPAELEVVAKAEDGEIMAIRHRSLPIYGLQYHPESILTPNGKQQLANFLQLSTQSQPKGI